MSTANARIYSATVAAAAAGCYATTLRGWRNRCGLLPASMEHGRHARYSVADIATIRLVVELADLGIEAQAAVDIAMTLAPHFEALGEDRPAERLGFGHFAVIAFDPETGEGHVDVLEDVTRVAEIFAEDAPRGVRLLVDLMRIALGVAERLRGMEPHSARAVIAGAMADVLAPEEGAE